MVLADSLEGHGDCAREIRTGELGSFFVMGRTSSEVSTFEGPVAGGKAMRSPW